MPADVMVSIGADGSALQTAINKIQKDLDTVANSISGVLDRVGGAIDGLKTMLGGAGTAIQKAFSITAPAAGLEALETAFTSLAGSAEEARAIIASLQQLSLKSPYDTEDIYKTGETLLKSGMSGQQVIDISRELAIIAGGDQGKLDALAKAVAKGRQGMKGFNESVFEAFASAGVDIVPALEQAVGKQGEDLKKAVAKGLSFDKVAAAISTLAADGGPLAANFDAQTDTFSGKIQQIKNLLTAGMQDMGSGINAAFGPALDALIAKIRQYLPTAKTFGAALGSGLTAAAEAAVQVGTAVQQLTEWFGSMSHESVMGLTAVATAFLAVKLNAVGAIAAIGPKWTAMCTSMAATFRTAMAAIKGALISSGIGAAVWGVGYIASVAMEEGAEHYVPKASASKEAESAEEEETAIGATAKGQAKLLEGSISKLQSMDEWHALRAQLDEQLAAAQQGMDAAEWGTTRDAWQQYRTALEGISENLQTVGLAHALDGEAAAKIARERDRQSQLLEQANEEAARNMAEYAKTQQSWQQKQEDDSYAAKATAEKGWWLQDAAAHQGVDTSGPDLGIALRTKMDELGSKPHDAAVKQQIADLQRLIEKHAELQKIKQETAKREALHQKEMEARRAGIAGDEKRKQILEDELAIEKKMAEYRTQGDTDADAKRKATEDVALDRVEQQTKEEKSYLESQKNDIIAQSGVAVGNGGRSIGLAQTTLQETRKQTGILATVEKILSTWKPGDIILAD